MEKQKKSIIPNSTQLPNIILDFILPRISEAEAKCLLYICRRTFGFHKDEDRISFSQFVKGIKGKDGKILDYGAGVSRQAVSEALKHLLKANAIIVKKSTKGNYYKINLEINSDELVKKVDQSRKLTKIGKVSRPKQVKLLDLQKKGKKEKESILQTAEPPAGDIKNDSKSHKPHSQLMEFWYETVKKTRGIRPVITRADAKNLKRILDLDILNQNEIEQLALYFLGSYTFRIFSPSISTFLSAGIINSLMNRMQNQADFWKEMNDLTARYFESSFQLKDASDMVDKLAELKEKLFKPIVSHSERTAIQEETAREMRLAAR